MASTGAKAVRRAEVLRRLSTHLGFEPVNLHAHAKGDTEMMSIMTLERIADAVELRFPLKRRDDAEDKQKEQPPVTVETVKEAPMQTTETVKIVDADESPIPIGQGKSTPARRNKDASK